MNSKKAQSGGWNYVFLELVFLELGGLSAPQVLSLAAGVLRISSTFKVDHFCHQGRIHMNIIAPIPLLFLQNRVKTYIVILYGGTIPPLHSGCFPLLPPLLPLLQLCLAMEGIRIACIENKKWARCPIKKPLAVNKAINIDSQCETKFLLL